MLQFKIIETEKRLVKKLEVSLFKLRVIAKIKKVITNLDYESETFPIHNKEKVKQLISSLWTGKLTPEEEDVIREVID